MFVCVCMRMYVYVCVCTCMYVYACVHVCMCACVHVCMFACMHVCVYACMHEGMYACIYAFDDCSHLRTSKPHNVTKPQGTKDRFSKQAIRRPCRCSRASAEPPVYPWAIFSPPTEHSSPIFLDHVLCTLSAVSAWDRKRVRSEVHESLQACITFCM